MPPLPYTLYVPPVSGDALLTPAQKIKRLLREGDKLVQARLDRDQAAKDEAEVVRQIADAKVLQRLAEEQQAKDFKQHIELDGTTKYEQYIQALEQLAASLLARGTDEAGAEASNILDFIMAWRDRHDHNARYNIKRLVRSQKIRARQLEQERIARRIEEIGVEEFRAEEARREEADRTNSFDPEFHQAIDENEYDENDYVIIPGINDGTNTNDEGTTDAVSAMMHELMQEYCNNKTTE
jgi:hypothetical protein